MRSRRLGAALNASGAGGDAAVEFPGLEILEPDSTRSRLLTTGFSVLVHGALIGALFLAAYLAPVEEIEKLIEITRIEDTVAKEEPAPAPKVIAEASRRIYDPSRMAVKPQIVSPAVVQKASPVVAASKLDMESLNPIKAPIEVKGAARVDRRQLKRLRAFVEEHAPRRAIVVCNERQRRVHEGVEIVPWGDFLGELWAGDVIR